MMDTAEEGADALSSIEQRLESRRDREPAAQCDEAVSAGIRITPYAATQFTTFDLPTYAKSVVTAANFALAYGARSVTDSRSEFGLRTRQGLCDGCRVQASWSTVPLRQATRRWSRRRSRRNG